MNPSGGARLLGALLVLALSLAGTAPDGAASTGSGVDAAARVDTPVNRTLVLYEFQELVTGANPPAVGETGPAAAPTGVTGADAFTVPGDVTSTTISWDLTSGPGVSRVEIVDTNGTVRASSVTAFCAGVQVAAGVCVNSVATDSMASLAPGDYEVRYDVLGAAHVTVAAFGSAPPLAD